MLWEFAGVKCRRLLAPMLPTDPAPPAAMVPEKLPNSMDPPPTLAELDKKNGPDGVVAPEGAKEVLAVTPRVGDGGCGPPAPEPLVLRLIKAAAVGSNADGGRDGGGGGGREKWLYRPPIPAEADGGKLYCASGDGGVDRPVPAAAPRVLEPMTGGVYRGAILRVVGWSKNTPY